MLQAVVLWSGRLFNNKVSKCDDLVEEGSPASQTGLIWPSACKYVLSKGDLYERSNHMNYAKINIFHE